MVAFIYSIDTGCLATRAKVRASGGLHPRSRISFSDSHS